jgi:hypothetical protein
MNVLLGIPILTAAALRCLRLCSRRNPPDIPPLPLQPIKVLARANQIGKKSAKSETSKARKKPRMLLPMFRTRPSALITRAPRKNSVLTTKSEKQN